MKIIVATNHFANEIKRALENKSVRFEIITGKDEIIFSGERTIYAGISRLKRDRYYAVNGNFDRLQWFNMMQFLRILEDQPIVITITVGDVPSFKLSQFIKRF